MRLMYRELYRHISRLKSGVRFGVKHWMLGFSLGIFIFYSSILYAASGTLSIQILNWDGTPAGGLQFPNPGNATTSDPWVRSTQYIRVQYSSTYAEWGIRVVTDNEIDIGQVYPKPLKDGEGPDKQWEWVKQNKDKYQYVGGKWQTGDDGVSFGGLIGPKKDNPNYRAALAWQVFKDPVSQPDSIYKDIFNKWNIGGNWNDDWAYIADKSDKWDGQPTITDIYDPGTWNPRYEMVVTGDLVVNFLTQHPVVSGSKSNPDPKPGDGDIAVYMAACFGFGLDETTGNYTGILPKGTYQTKIYLELVYDI